MTDQTDIPWAIGRSVFVKFGAVVASFGLTVFATREFGADAAAPFFWAIGAASSMVVVSVLGGDGLLVQKAARLSASGADVVKLRDRVHTNGLFLSLLISLAFTVVSEFARADSTSRLVFAGLMVLVPALTSMTLVGAVVRATGGYLYFTVCHGLLLPVGTLVVGVVAAASLDSFRSKHLLAVYTCLALVLAATMALRSSATHGPLSRNFLRLRFDGGVVRQSFPFFTTPALNVLLQFMPVVLLGFFSAPAEVSIYFAALRVSLVLSFVLAAANLVVGPNLSRAFEQGSFGTLRRLYLMTVVLGAITAGPLVAAALFGSERLMSLFGDGFTAGGEILVVLVFGQCINAITGSVLLLLAMTDNQGVLATLNIVVFVSSGLVAFVLIPRYGAVGAAWVNSSATIFLNLSAAVMCFRLVPQLRTQSISTTLEESGV